MKVSATLMPPLETVGEQARKLEEQGYSVGMSAELANDPLLPLAMAAQTTETLELYTGITVAFARSPMPLAASAHDINVLSKGRLALGLGSQIRPHITKRFSMPWTSPAPQMREYIQALRAIWNCWYNGEKLDFRGDVYTHTLMTPMFTPTDLTYGAPRVVLAAVGPGMTEVAGEVADGMIAHGFTTEKYLREVTLPSIEAGLAKSGRSSDDFELSIPAFVVTGRDEREFADVRRATCKQIAFYGSTPAYRGVLEAEGCGELQTELNQMSKQGLWDEMGERIEDDLLEKIAIVGLPHEIAPRLHERFGDVIDLASAKPMGARDGGLQAQLAKELRSLG